MPPPNAVVEAAFNAFAHALPPGGAPADELVLTLLTFSVTSTEVEVLMQAPALTSSLRRLHQCF